MKSRLMIVMLLAFLFSFIPLDGTDVIASENHYSGSVRIIPLLDFNTNIESENINKILEQYFYFREKQSLPNLNTSELVNLITSQKKIAEM